MNWLQRIPGIPASPSGLEWWLLQRLPRWLLLGTLLGCLAGWFLHSLLPAWSAEVDPKQAGIALYTVIGLTVLYWTLLLTLGLGCVVVLIMKGPAYIADRHPSARDSDTPD